MNILIINHYAGSPSHGMEYRPYYFGREWVRQKHRVTIAASSFSHVRYRQPNLTGGITELDIDGIKYLWYRTPSYCGNGVGRVRNIFSFVRKIWLDVRRLGCRYSPDIVIASSTYPFDALPAFRLSRLCSAKFVFEVHDLWPLTLIELGGMSPLNPFIMLMQWAENYAYRHADHVVSMLPNAAEHMCQHGMNPEKFCYIPNGVVISEWASDLGPLPNQHREAIDKIRQSGRFILGYLGGHTLSNDLDTLLEAAANHDLQNVCVVLVGQGPDKERLQNRAQTLGLRNIIFLPPVEKKLVPSLLAEMDSCYMGEKRSRLYRFGICANKLFDYMMAGKPVIHATEMTKDLVVEAACGIIIPPQDVSALAEAIRTLAGYSKEERQSMGQRGKKYVMQEHDYTVLAQRFLDVIGRDD